MDEDIGRAMNLIGEQARRAADQLAITPAEKRRRAIAAMSDETLKNAQRILDGNKRDLDIARKKNLSDPLVDRLRLTEERIKDIASSLSIIANLTDPVGSIVDEWQRPNGLTIKKVRTPLGVIGVIYESRPNVTADAVALCIKSGNAVVLRGGSDAFHTNAVLFDVLETALRAAGLPHHSAQFVSTTDRDAVGCMLEGLNGAIDVVVPRGGRSLVERVTRESRVPVFAHLEGLCHIYVDRSANLTLATNVVVNAKMRRPGICGAVETLLVDRAEATNICHAILPALAAKGCQIRGCVEICSIFPAAQLASESDWRTEYLDAILSVKVVDGIEDAIAHIKRYSSQHTEAVIAENPDVVRAFFRKLDSAILMHNTSTQFADGGEFGFGGEIGIATGKLHARGPIGVEQLTTFQYHVYGQGQLRH